MNIPVRPLAVLGYALKHQHTELIKPAAYRAYTEKYTRATVIEALGEDYIGRWVSLIV